MLVDFDTGAEIQGVPAAGDDSTDGPIQVDEFVKLAKPTKWVVEGRIASGATTIIAGQAKKARKTLLLLHLVEQTAQGATWLGHQCNKRPVIFVGFEGGASFLAQRVIDVGHKGILLPDDERIPASFMMGLAGYRWVLERLRRAASTGEPWPVMVCIDTLSQVLAACDMDENDNMGVTRFLQEHDDLAYRAGAALVFAHHFSKSHYQMRGASSMSALCNWCEINMLAGAMGLLKLDWNLRHAIGATDGVKVNKPNGTFTFEPVDAKDLPRDDKRSTAASEKKQETIEVITSYLKERPGQDLSYGEIAAYVHEKIGGTRPPSVKENIMPKCNALAAELGLTAATRMGCAGVHVPSVVVGANGNGPLA